MGVQPRPPVGGGDPLRLAPGQQRLHQRVGAAERLQPPRPGVRDDDAHRREQLAHLHGVAQVGALPAGGVREDGRVALAADGAGVVLVPWAGPRGGEDELLQGRPVDRQALLLELDAQQRGGRLRVRRAHHPRRRGGGEALLLQRRRLQGQGRPRAQPLRGGEPAAADGLGAQVAVRPDGGVGVAGVLGGAADEVEQVTTGVTGQAGGVEPPGVGPGERRVGVPAAPDEAVHLEDVPAAVDPDPGPYQRCCRVSGRPPDPAGVPLGLQCGDTRHDLGARPGRGLPVTDEGAEVAGERHRDLLRAVGGGGHGLHPTSVTTWSRGVARPGRRCEGAGRGAASRPALHAGSHHGQVPCPSSSHHGPPGTAQGGGGRRGVRGPRRFAADRGRGGRARLRRRPRCRGALGGHPRGLLRLGGGRALGRQHQPRQPPRRRARPDGLLRQRRRHRRAGQGVPSQPEPGGCSSAGPCAA